MSEVDKPRLGRLEHMIATQAVARFRQEVLEAMEELKGLIPAPAATVDLLQSIEALAERTIDACREDVIETALAKFVASVTEQRRPF